MREEISFECLFQWKHSQIECVYVCVCAWCMYQRKWKFLPVNYSWKGRVIITQKHITKFIFKAEKLEVEREREQIWEREIIIDTRGGGKLVRKLTLTRLKTWVWKGLINSINQMGISILKIMYGNEDVQGTNFYTCKITNKERNVRH